VINPEVGFETSKLGKNSPTCLVARNKADAVARLHPSCGLSDQVADLDGVSLGKPGSRTTRQRRKFATRAAGGVPNSSSGWTALPAHLDTRLLPSKVRFRDSMTMNITCGRANFYDRAGSAKVKGWHWPARSH
jgi:predicted house-cleaning NTP pyrophosphatase (Maf/HAM1 superfamily)